MKNWLKFLSTPENRTAPRKLASTVFAYYWDGDSATPTPHAIRDISSAGMYLLTEQRWYRGTMMKMTLLIADRMDEDMDNSVSVLSRVIRSGQDGVGFKFVFLEAATDPQGSATSKTIEMANKKALKRFLERVRQRSSSKS